MNNHAHSEIRTRDPINKTAVDVRPRPRSHVPVFDRRAGFDYRQSIGTQQSIHLFNNPVVRSAGWEFTGRLPGSSRSNPLTIPGRRTVVESAVLAAVFFLSFFTAVISISILSHTVRFHLFISTYVVKLVAGTIL